MSWAVRQSLRRLRERETFLVPRKRAGAFSICLVYPNRYHLGMSNLGFLTVHSLLNDLDDVVCDRAFFPDPPELKEYRLTGTPLLSLDAERPLSDYDLIAFSIPFEGDFPAVPDILSLAALPPLQHQRDDRHPLVMGGGAALFLNPEPVADFFDLIYLGEAEVALASLIDSIRSFRGERSELLRHVCHTPAVYVPSLHRLEYDGAAVVSRTPLDGAPERILRATLPAPLVPSSSPILTPDTEFSSMPLIEVSRGCPRGCRFCAAGFIYHPYRISCADSILTSLDRFDLRGLRIGLVGAAVSDHPEIERICRTIVDRGGTFSLSSLRIDALSPELLEQLRRAGCRSATIAPEGLSQRLRNMIKKGIDEAGILRSVELLVEHDVLTVRMYFIYGLPTENESDILEFFDLVAEARRILLQRSRSKGRIGSIVVSLAPFIPKPFTPFQWCGMEQISSLERKSSLIRSRIATLSNVSISFESLRDAWIQALFSRGDRRLSTLLASGRIDRFRQQLRRSDYPAELVVTRTIPPDQILPWGFILPDRFDHLRREYELAFGAGS